MRLNILKQAVSDKFKVNLDENSRKRKYVYAKKVFCKLARDTGATFKTIGNEINTKHCNVLFHVNSVDVIGYEDKDKHDELIDELGLDFSKPFFDIEKAKIKKEIIRTTDSETLKRIKSITDIISEWDIETLQEFKQTRLEPFNASLKHRVMPKTIKEVKGALLNNRVKNPVLC
ncbi:hypothetical protein N9609_00885 [bacterium]|nr:hypothetical protein [bacterium]